MPSPLEIACNKFASMMQEFGRITNSSFGKYSARGMVKAVLANSHMHVAPWQRGQSLEAFQFELISAYYAPAKMIVGGCVDEEEAITLLSPIRDAMHDNAGKFGTIATSLLEKRQDDTIYEEIIRKGLQENANVGQLVATLVFVKLFEDCEEIGVLSKRAPLVKWYFHNMEVQTGFALSSVAEAYEEWYKQAGLLFASCVPSREDA